MRILIDLIDNVEASSGANDHRYSMFVDIGRALRARGHDVAFMRVKRAAKIPSGFKEVDKLGESVDLYIAHSPYRKTEKMAYIRWLREGGWFRKKRHVLVYDHGWLRRSLVVDRKLLFMDSYYADKLATLSRDNYDPLMYEKYRQHLLAGGISKRPQPTEGFQHPRPYIFVPGQVLYDVSVVFYSKTGLLELLAKVIDFAGRHGVDVLFKPHPGMTEDKNHGKQQIHDACVEFERRFSYFRTVDASIYDLMRGALFTACINSGSIVDNFITETPVYCCGASVYSATAGVVYNEDVEAGLADMYSRNYDASAMVLAQKQIVWWLRTHLLQDEFSIERNLALLEHHSGLKF